MSDTNNYDASYKRLNDAQKQAVDLIDGPVLVIAGPGTGKTQLLSLRVATILERTDASASNILCLTFTESGAANMRERLTRFIGLEAYNVTISTYHAFGGNLIKQFPEYFSELRLENPVDSLGQYFIVERIVEGLRYDNPLKQTQYHLRDLISTISEIKRALLSADDLRTIAAENSDFIIRASSVVSDALQTMNRMPGSLAKAAPYFEAVLAGITPLVPVKPANAQFGSLAHLALRELEIALANAREVGKGKPLTDWKNAWLAKDRDGNYIIDGELKNRRIQALADVLEEYETALSSEGLYDFDDMILRSIQALETHDELRFSLQEKYLYLLLDEFQDTNAAQLRLVELLTDNPANAKRPNVLAVGDDDQAIYAFQGAQYSNMLDFYNMYDGVQAINLTENYRSHADVLHAARSVAEQIGARLHHHFEGASKQLVAANTSLPAAAHIDRREFMSDVAEYQWIAARIAELIAAGSNPADIAVLAPKHKQLEPLVPFLNQLKVPVRYEKRENILETPIVRQLLTISRLVLALHDGKHAEADSLWPEVLSYDFWRIPIKHLWQFSWQVSDAPRDEQSAWSKAILDDERLHQPALIIIALSTKAGDETLEMMLDYIIGSCALDVHDEKDTRLRSPLRAYYASNEVREHDPEAFYEALSHLTVLRTKLRAWQKTTDTALTLKDLLRFVSMYDSAGERMINSSPYTQAEDAVQLMTVFKAKGLEFEHVFLPHALDDVWGESSRGNSNKISLPANLAPIRHAGANEDERLRIFFVALTRAKFGLHITSHTANYSGRHTKRLKYLNEQEQPGGEHHAMALPESARRVHHDEHTAPSLETLEHHWHARHIEGLGQIALRNLLEHRLAEYQLSPTHLNAFFDLENCGPEQFVINTLLRFPQAPTSAGQFGNAIHETLEWLQHKQETGMPDISDVLAQFAQFMKAKKLSAAETVLMIQRGEKALRAYLANRAHIFSLEAVAEKNFRREGVFVGKTHLSGKIDRMEIDADAKTITVVDYKTGTPATRWAKTHKLHKYSQQLYCYKLLIEGSRTYRDYQVTAGRLEFTEPDEDGAIHTLELRFEEDELARTRQLIAATWRSITSLELPDITAYGTSMSDIIRFEDDMAEKATVDD